MVHRAFDNRERNDLWDAFCGLSLSFTEPQIIRGHFNSLLWVKKRIGGDQVLLRETLDFATCIDICGVQEIKWHRSFFRWNNKQRPTRVFFKLVRVLINRDNVRYYPHIYFEAMPKGVFDHTPLCIHVRKEGFHRHKKFYNM